MRARRTRVLAPVVFRLANAVACRSFFQPDEYWQSLEVAHRWVFGFGYETWEWRTKAANVAVGAGAAENWQEWVGVLRDGGRGGIRSPLSVLPTALVYGLAKQFGLDDRGEWLVLEPRLLQACVAASTDIAVSRLAGHILGPEYTNAALVVSLTSFFNFFTSTRTLSNSTETALTAWALCWWPWQSREGGDSEVIKENRRRAPQSREGGSSLMPALCLAALATIIRPSNAIIWIILGARRFVQSSPGERILLARTAVFVSILAIALCIALDTAFYHTPTFTPLRFLSVNVFHSISLFYGQSPWHFYLLQALPILLASQLPYCVDGVGRFFRSSSTTTDPGASLLIRNRRAVKELASVVGGTVIAYSLLSHKEWRFLHPVLPILHLFVTVSLVSTRATLPPTNVPTPTEPVALPRRLGHGLAHPFDRLAIRTRIRPRDLFVLSLSLGPALYLSIGYGRGQNNVAIWLRDRMRADATPRATKEDADKDEDESRKIKSVGFVMPCHSTPWQAYFHSRKLEDVEEVEGTGRGGGRAWFIECEPPTLGQPKGDYLDQTDWLYASPSTYFLDRFPRVVDPAFPPSPRPRRTDPYSLPPSTSSDSLRAELRAARFDRGWTHEWPSHLVLFGSILNEPCRAREGCRDVGELLDQLGYRVEEVFWNGIGGWHEDPRRKGHVVVLTWSDPARLRQVSSS
ncbi:hypothetical protein JCM10212_000292 [Sporobolomyces blumeae]